MATKAGEEQTDAEGDTNPGHEKDDGISADLGTGLQAKAIGGRLAWMAQWWRARSTKSTRPASA